MEKAQRAAQKRVFVLARKRMESGGEKTNAQRARQQGAPLLRMPAATQEKKCC